MRDLKGFAPAISQMPKCGVFLAFDIYHWMVYKKKNINLTLGFDLRYGLCIDFQQFGGL